MALTRRFGYIGVMAVLPDSPAAKIGLRIGDILEKIAGFNTSQMAIDQAQLLLKGQPGTTVPLSVIRRGKAEPQDMTITLAKLAPSKLVVEDKLQGDVAYLRVADFDAGTSKQIRERLVQLQKAGAKKLILDLRDCAMGDDQEGIATAQLFLQSGTITTLKGQTVLAGGFGSGSGQGGLEPAGGGADRQWNGWAGRNSGQRDCGQQARSKRWAIGPTELPRSRN